MILVDSSVWIDYFKGVNNEPSDRPDALLGQEPLLVGDLILAEVLQGFPSESTFEQARKPLISCTVIDVGDEDIAVRAARNYGVLRGFGITVRKTIDTIIATRCIVSNYRLLHNDRDFDAFVTHLGLQAVV